MYEGWSEGMLREEFDYLTAEMKRSRLRVDVLEAQIKEKEFECKEASVSLKEAEKSYNILVEYMTQKDGD